MQVSTKLFEAYHSGPKNLLKDTGKTINIAQIQTNKSSSRVRIKSASDLFGDHRNIKQNAFFKKKKKNTKQKSGT